MKQKKLSFPHIGDYYIPINLLIKNTLTNIEVLTPPPITKRTIDLGAKYCPDLVCVPFKYNVGNYIEALEQGANYLVQAGGGCRFGYYSELQEQILRDLGYDFEFINIIDADHTDIQSVYRIFKSIHPSLSIKTFGYYFYLTIRMVNIMDELQDYIRKNIGFEVENGSFEEVERQFLKELKTVTTYNQLKQIHRKYKHLLNRIPINKPDTCLKIAIVGELYTSMEPFSSYFMEIELAKMKIEVDRFMNITFLLFQKGRQSEYWLKQCGKYLKYPIGADGTDSVARSKVAAENNYDGVIHIKPFACTPEVNAIPMMQRISEDYNIPILYFSFDTQTSETAIKTRLEAFHDMLVMRKEGVL